MPDPLSELPRTPEPIGVAADHGGFELKHHLVRTLQGAGYDVTASSTASRSDTKRSLNGR